MKKLIFLIAGVLLLMPRVEATTVGASPTCDGVNDDAPAINAAIATLPRGGVLYLPVGTCLLNSSLLLRDGLTIEGSGMGATILMHGAGAPAPIDAPSSHNATVENLTVDGNRGANGAFLNGEVNLYGAGSANLIRRIEVRNFNWLGIVAAAPGTTVEESTITGPGDPLSGGVYGIWYADPNAKGIIVRHNRITDMRWGAIFVGGSSLVQGNYLSGNHRQTVPVGGGQIASSESAGGHALVSVIVDANIIEAGGGTLTSGLEVDGPAWQITNNRIRGQAYYGIIVQTGTNHLISGNIVEGSGVANFYVAPGASALLGVNSFSSSVSAPAPSSTPTPTASPAPTPSPTPTSTPRECVRCP